mmetsp:Transcript_17125/g.19079  ORF Transcript_17125/g.19079 Transcript_17125/m.19079 type:complete len:289 (-) Transcript_17125:396-1262(-)|eukprot:CAMPEP_0194132876 /NCGR_PEP_ID=MMETSP0152-20130528/3236_1 /TAXON_ID=1049557 /ORGANISM="Thalassiothrix antarctica, Strain L6-D1" /LENGTH=288 /DNA_ID=CAMNT_0038828063 /DNA_START=331 /DNA_END=1197 /DNA_ORIENTATION=+
MVPDPYKALGLEHNASAIEIKQSYRKLALRNHPDRLVARGASEIEFRTAGIKFAAISSAYQLLTDGCRKRDYDHIYRFGGYDDEKEDDEYNPIRQPYKNNPANTSAEYYDTNKGNNERETKKSTGIGYAISDPLSYFFPSLSKNGHQAVAGIQIPSRIHLVNPPPGGGLRFAFSSGQFSTSKSGSKKFTSKTTQFVQGKKFSRKETTTVHPDGRKEIIIEGNNYVQRRWTNPTKKKNIPEYTDSADDVTSVKMQPEHSDDPWYVSAWKGVRERMTMCLNHPCGELMAQ